MTALFTIFKPLFFEESFNVADFIFKRLPGKTVCADSFLIGVSDDCFLMTVPDDRFLMAVLE